MEGFLRYEFGGLIFGGAYFRNFMVDCVWLRLYLTPKGFYVDIFVYTTMANNIILPFHPELHLNLVRPKLHSAPNDEYSYHLYRTKPGLF